MIDDLKIEAYALENAVRHEGKSQAGSVLSSLFSDGLDKKEAKDAMLKIQKAVERINGYSVEEQKVRFEDYKHLIKKREVHEGLPELPNAVEGKVVMRVAPYPSGPLHIGNTRQVILNDEYCKKYKGKLILVIDDTIGSEEKPIEPLAYKMIPEGLDWLGVNYDKNIIYKSDRLEIYYAYAEEMIKKGYMYVCSCSQEEMHENREKGIECGCRHLPEDQQLERWKKMFKAKQGEYTVRLKTSMQNENPAFRDRIMFRISDREHAKVGRKYSVWPLLEFSWAIDDHLLGATHIIRGIELMMETEVEKFIWDIFGWKHPETLHTGLLRIEGVKLSKSKGSKEVNAGTYIGWNDPRLWSLQSLRDRGIQPKAIREFILGLGMSKSNIAVAIDSLYALNKKLLDKVPRYFFVTNPVEIHIKGSPELKAVLPLHPTEKLGVREYRALQDFYISKEDYDAMSDGNYRLMHLLNFSTSQLISTKPRDFSFVSVEPDAKLNVKYIHWLSGYEKNILVDVMMPDGSIVSGYGEPALLNLKEGDVVQFERFGFVCLHKLNKKMMSAEFWFSHK